MVMARMRSGFAVIGDTQHLPGYSLLLCDDVSVDHLSDLDWPRRTQFLLDLSLIGEAVQLHGHVHPRYEWEPPERIAGPVWLYPREKREAF